MGLSAESVIVYGATGWTGQLVSRTLHERGVRVIVAGRGLEKLQMLAASLPGTRVRHLRSNRASDIAEALAGVAVVVNCAGPSTELGLAVVDAAIAARVHYIDITGEESFVRRLYGTRDAAAFAASIAVLPAFAGKGALGDWGAATAIASLPARPGGDKPLVAIAYAHTSEGFVRPSPGSALSAAGQGFIRPRDRRVAPLERRFDFPPPFGRGAAIRVPGAEDISVVRHTHAAEASTYVSIDPGRALNGAWNQAILGAGFLMPAIARAMLSTPIREALRAIPEPLTGGLPSFAASVEVALPSGIRTMGIVAPDAYTVTSDIVAYGVERLLDGPPKRCGVLAPSELCPGAEALAALERAGKIAVLGWDGPPIQM